MFLVLRLFALSVVLAFAAFSVRGPECCDFDTGTLAADFDGDDDLFDDDVVFDLTVPSTPPLIGGVVVLAIHDVKSPVSFGGDRRLKRPPRS